MTNLELVAFCEQAAEKKTLYMWGTYGKKITESLISAKQKQYSTRYSSARVQFLKKHIDGETLGCDCSGLIKWALWTKGNILLSPKYEAATDRGTNGLFREAKEKGKISSLPEIPGVLVWKDGHVGVYVGNRDVVECTLGARGDGVVFSPLKKGGWTHWLKLPEVEYVEPTKPEEETETTAPQPITNAKKKISLLKKLKKILIKH